MKKSPHLINFWLILATVVLVAPWQGTLADMLSNSTEQAQSANSVRALSEPTIRVGIDKMATPVKVESTFDYTVYEGGVQKGVLAANTPAMLSFKKNIYSFKSDSLSFTGADAIRLAPSDPDDYFTIINLTRKLAGRKGNFNAYQGTLEYRFSPKSKAPYIINEVSLEDYVAGIGEANNADPIEYTKALLTAARTYGFVNIASTTPKHLFDVHASTVDQLYLGYNSALAMPNVVQAAEDTVGEMVTYNDQPVITFYFGHSDGHTRGDNLGHRPWLASVVAPYDKGMKLWGHGVGMSCHDAEEHAIKDSWSYDQILRYYYTDTQVNKEY